MIPLLTREEARAMDADASARLGLPTLVLMENAARGATGTLLDRFRPDPDRVVIVGGVGQNGGDAWGVARHLVVAGLRPRVFLVGDEAQVAGDARVNLDALRAMGVPVAHATAGGTGELESALRGAGVVVDGIFGTGLTRAVAGAEREVIRVLNAFPAPKFALDLPSGVDADTGAVLGEAVEASVTATFGGWKRGLAQYPAAARAGEVVLISLGVPFPVRAGMALLEPADVPGLLPRRSRDAHKGNAGHVVVVAGAEGTAGAAVLAGLGALRAGAGLVTVLSRTALAGPPELMTRVIGSPGVRTPEEVGQFVTTRARAVVLGPGLGVDAEARALVAFLLRTLALPVVVDADALSVSAERLEAHRSAPGPRILTPHPGEAARLLGMSSADVQSDRIATALRLADETGQTAVLKGAGTLIASPSGTLRACLAGTPAMAVAGAGDVLAGVIAAQAAALAPLEAASLGVLLHALAGEHAAAREQGATDRGLLASDIAHAVPDVLAG